MLTLQLYPYWDIKYPFIFLSDNLHLHISLWVAFFPLSFFTVLIKVIYIHDDIQLEELFILNSRHYGAESSPLCLQQGWKDYLFNFSLSGNFDKELKAMLILCISFNLFVLFCGMRTKCREDEKYFCISELFVWDKNQIIHILMALGWGDLQPLHQF